MSTPTTPAAAALRLTQGAALLLSGLTSGASLGLSTFLVPRLLESPTPLMLRQWAHMYRAGATTMPFAAAAAAAAYAYAWLAAAAAAAAGGGGTKARGGCLAAAGLLTVGIVPYTLVVMRGTNARLHALAGRVALVAEEKGEGEGEGEGKEEGKEEGEGVVVVEEEKGAKALVDWWGVLNLGRAVMLIAGSVCGLVATV